MAKHSAGILLYRYKDGKIQVLLVHPGGPFWANKDLGAWSIPKGLIEPTEVPLETAVREFKEETGFHVTGKFLDLGEIKLPSSKILHAWALEGDINASRVTSNHFYMEWPPHSGRTREFPEVDDGAWFYMDEARLKINKGQLPLLDRLISILG